MPRKKHTATPTSTKLAQAAKAVKRSRSANQSKPKTKKQLLIDLLASEKPVTVEMVRVTVEMVSKTLDWQHHTVRAAISGLRKAGFAIDTAKPSIGGATCYRIVGHAQSTDASAL